MRQKPLIRVIADLTEEELERLCEFLELLDRWDHEGQLTSQVECR
jgi:hypothetical protein